MKALTVCQPWSWAIVRGLKRFENRTWRTDYRGTIAIHAGKSRAWLGREGDLLPGLPPTEELPFGALVGTVELVDIWPASLCGGDPFATGPWCWVLEGPKSFDPIPYRGKLMLFDVPDAIMPRD